MLVALLRMGSANATQLARATGIQRPNVYPVLSEIRAKGLAHSTTGKTSVWRSLGPEETLDRLYSQHEETLRELQQRREQTRQLLVAQIKPDESSTVSFIDLLPNAVQTKRTYERLLTEAQSEVLVFNQPPYSWPPGQVNPIVMDMLARGVAARAIYESGQFDAPEAVGFRRQHEVYIDHGLEARVVDKLPFKLVVVDRRAALVSLADPLDPESGYPTFISIEHPGFAAGQAAGFEHYWGHGRPYERLDTAPEA